MMDVDNCPSSFACFSSQRISVFRPNTLQRSDIDLQGMVRLKGACRHGSQDWELHTGVLTVLGLERPALFSNTSKASARLIFQ